MNTRCDRKIVIPGEKLGVIEEFIPKKGTFAEDGFIYSNTTGQLFIDKITKNIQVNSKTNTPLFPKIGDAVIGRVSSVQDRTMNLDIFQINNRTVKGKFTGTMHISDASRRYVKTMFDVCKINDILRAKVISLMNKEIHLTTQGNELGVLNTTCSNCGNTLTLKTRRLQCPMCKNYERRKVAIGYLGSS